MQGRSPLAGTSSRFPGGPAVGGHAVEELTAEPDVSLLWTELPVEAIEECRLPCAIRADQTEDLARFDRDGYVVECGDPPKFFD